ncbi:MAG: response regulator transcription factor [Phycisphaerales bacterium]|nr:response regulator transcription factor [Phycisphaerales bacterium]
MSKKIAVLLADDHALVRATLADRLAAEADLEVVGQVGNADEAVSQCIQRQPDIVLMDIDMPGLQCFEAARTIQARCSNTRIIYLSAFFSDRYIEEALTVEAAGYVTKSEPPEAVIEAIRTAVAGRVYFSPEVRSRIIFTPKGARLSSTQPTRLSTLTQRELQVLRYLAKGMSKKEIARTINLSVSTVERHSDRLMKKLDIHDRVELARFAIREGLAEA